MSVHPNTLCAICREQKASQTCTFQFNLDEVTTETYPDIPICEKCKRNKSIIDMLSRVIVISIFLGICSGILRSETVFLFWCSGIVSIILVSSTEYFYFRPRVREWHKYHRF